ncbi:MAG: D-alanyl-D-alanine carboxypeptidase [Ruminococcus sp.]|nr:D-alanyl-D-alanine carboxypeptidase [Ruminococcus sp.]
MIKHITKLAVCACACVLMLVQTASSVFASGKTDESLQAAAEPLTVAQQLDSVTAPSYILVEMQTDTVLFEKGAQKQFYTSHLNKLMTLLLLAEDIQAGRVKTDDLFTATDRANEQGDPQIWLDKGEKISVDELIKAITVGNANDAAVTVAENLCASEKKFTAKMNEKAKALGMQNTVFKDCTGVDKANTTNVKDLSRLCKALSKYDFLVPYFKTWMVNVRSGKAELVNSNRLVRNYSGLSGVKACSSKESGSCGCVTAEKSKLQLCAVVLGCADNDKRDADVKKLLKCGAESFQLYRPQVPEELLENISVTGGEALECELEVQGEPLVIIKRGTSKQLKASWEKEEKLTAPVEKGKVCAQYTLEYEKKPVCTVCIVAKQKIKKMNWLCGVKKLLYNLIKL